MDLEENSIAKNHCNVDRLFARQLNAEQLSTLKSFTLAWSMAGILMISTASSHIFQEKEGMDLVDLRTRLSHLRGRSQFYRYQTRLTMRNCTALYSTTWIHMVHTEPSCALTCSGLRNLTTPEEDDIPYSSGLGGVL